VATEVKNLPPCPLCGAGMRYRFSAPCDYRKPDNLKSYSVYWCAVCDFGNIWKRPLIHEIPAFYELTDYHTHHSTKTSTDDEKQSPMDLVRGHISWRLDKGTDLDVAEVTRSFSGIPATICEIGCGNGANLVKFRDAGYDVVGIEPDKNAKDVAGKVLHSIYEGTAEDLPAKVSERVFAVVLMSHVLEHCLDVNKALSNAEKLIAEGGVLVVEVPNCNALGFQLYEAAWPWSDIPRHLNFFTPNSLKRVLAAHGFDVTKIYYRGFCRQFSNAWLNTEKEIWQAFNDNSKATPDFKLRSLWFLLRSMIVPKERKYDSVRVIVKKSLTTL